MACKHLDHLPDNCPGEGGSHTSPCKHILCTDCLHSNCFHSICSTKCLHANILYEVCCCRNWIHQPCSHAESLTHKMVAEKKPLTPQLPAPTAHTETALVQHCSKNSYTTSLTPAIVCTTRPHKLICRTNRHEEYAWHCCVFEHILPESRILQPSTLLNPSPTRNHI